MIGSLPALLRLQQRGGTVARQQAANLLCALETVRLLIASDKDIVSAEALAGNAESAANVDAILKSGMFDILVGATLGDGAISSAAVRFKVGGSTCTFRLRCSVTANGCSRCAHAEVNSNCKQSKHPMCLARPLPCSAWSAWLRC